MTTLDYGFKRTLSGSIDEVEARVEEALRAEGFGLLTRIDVASTFEAKLGVDFPEYRILGACNPTLAHAAIGKEPDIGLLLPCNVVVYQTGASDHVVVAILDPERQLAVAGRSDLTELAADVRARMKRVIEAL